jgi:uncharacterized protein YkwD
VIGAAAFYALERSVAIGVALVVQLVAIVVIGDVFAAAPPADAGLPSIGESSARAAPAARGERVMTFDLIVDLALDTRQAASAEDESLPSADLVTEPAAAPAAEGVPEPETPLIAEPIPQPRPDPTPAPAPRATPAPPAVTTSSATQQAELRMLALMNESRLRGGLVPLALDAVVSDAARRHSAVEAQYRYVYHDGPDGTAASRYVPVCGSGWYGENTGKVWSGGVEVLHREFMAEPWEPINHRTNIMDPNFRRAGIGAVQGPDAIYVTVAFCR